MPFLMVPNEVEANRATVWVGSINEARGPAALEYGGTRANVDQQAWEPLDPQDQQDTFLFQRVPLNNLESFKPYSLILRNTNGEQLAQANLTTLPATLPSLSDSKPFTVMLGSCFYWKEDKGALSATFNRLPTNARPDVKFLCGDQVYLDAPYYNFITTKHNRAQLKYLFLNTYLQTWAPIGGSITMYDVLRSGANFFSPDDHEFWNNAPSSALAVADSRDDGRRGEWETLAHRFYQVFQGTPKPFAVNPVSFFTADTRSNRSANTDQFMNEPDLARLEEWIRTLAGPGVLVVGQPVFAKPGGFLSRWTDYGLPDYKQQYARLVRAIAAAQHNIVILTGDVHYGRIATCNLPNGKDVVEIISSPMSLVEAPVGFSLLGGGWKAAPNSLNVPGSPGITTDHRFNFARNHFLTLEFRADGVGAKLTVRDWPFKPDGSPTAMPGRVIFERPLR